VANSQERFSFHLEREDKKKRRAWKKKRFQPSSHRVISTLQHHTAIQHRASDFSEREEKFYRFFGKFFIAWGLLMFGKNSP
jgi:hypothetical protein